MIKSALILIGVFSTALAPVFAQSPSPKMIDHTVFDSWKSVRNTKISDKAEWISYEIQPQMGDGYVYFYKVSDASLDSVARGSAVQFTENGKYALIVQKVPYQTLRKAKLAKKKDEDLPKDSLLVYELGTGKIISTFAQVKEVRGDEAQSWIVVWHAKVKATPAKKKKKLFGKKPVEIKSEGTVLEIVNPVKRNEAGKKKAKNFGFSYDWVTEYAFSKTGDLIAFAQQKKVGKTDSTHVYVFRPAIDNRPLRIFSAKGFAKSLSTDEAGTQLAFLSSADTSKQKVYSLWYWNTENATSSLLVDETTTGIPQGWCVSEHGTISFSPKGEKLFLGTATKPVKEPKDSLLEEEKFRVDVWSWTDEYLQPQQLKNLEREKKRSYTGVFRLAENKFVQLCDSTVPQCRLVLKGDGETALGFDNRNYRRESSWVYPSGTDLYAIDLKTGTRKLLRSNQRFDAALSASGHYLAYYDRSSDDWFSISLATGDTLNLTGDIPEEFYEDDNGNPTEEDAYGLMGWAEEDRYLYLYSRYDVWRVDPTGQEKPLCLTRHFGKESKTVLRYVKTDREENFIREENILLHAFNEVGKQSGFYTLDPNKRLSAPQQLLEGDYEYSFTVKAKKSDTLIFTRMSFREYPDLWVSNTHFENGRKISNANPQQQEYRWGTVELVHWNSFSGKPLEGLLYKPEDFDSTRKYPLLVYFYEKYADELHNYYSPRPSASIINPSEYVSNGYVVFFPDILYDEGEPGQSAYDCIVSGTDYIVSKGFVDTTRMGLQGQSWGGYQTAYLITRTNKYRAAMAGAPVSNMTSAYGGIRWGSGMSRMFQYEKTQSRLGVTLWEDRERYLRNSPLFFADKVETPLLMMHNDKDGAVPWYQGIEYFTALRRLDKPVWMLNYNDDDHNLTRRANQKDLSIRMRQFFDHYLLDKPMPDWMKRGLPATEKGLRTGYELK